MRFLCFTFIFLVFASQAWGHSWLELPLQRDARPPAIDPLIPNDVLAHPQPQPNGCPFSRADGLDLTYGLSDGTIRPLGDPFAMAHVKQGSELCVRWASNGHFNDPRRGYLNISLSYDENPTQSSFDGNLVAENVDFAFYEGIRVPIPTDTPLGVNTLQFAWWYCGAEHYYVSCADIVVVNDDSAPLYGIPIDYSGELGNCIASLPPVATELPDGSDPIDTDFCSLPAPRGALPSSSLPSLECSLSVNILYHLENSTFGTYNIGEISCTTVESSPSGPPSGPPSGRCLTDADCPSGSWCKNWQTAGPDGTWVCHGF